MNERPSFPPIKVLRDCGPPMPWWHWLVAAAALAGVVFTLCGCSSLPDTLTVRTPTGTKLATVDLETGDVVLTRAAMRLLVRR